MASRSIFISGFILLSFPFVGIYTEWKLWLAFGIGVYFILYFVYRAVRSGREGS